MEHVALEGVADLIPGEHFLFVDELAAGAAFEGVEVDKGLVRDHARKGKSDAGILGVVVIAAVEMLVILDGEDLLEENEAVEDGGLKTTGDGDDLADAVGMPGREGEGAESADRGTDGGVEFFDAEVVEEREMGVDNVGDIEMGEGGAEGLAGFGVDAGRAGGAVAAAEVVGADDKEAVGVDGFAGSHHFVPPSVVELLGPVVAAFGRGRVVSGDVVGAGEGVEEKDGIGLIVVQFTPRGVSELRRGNTAAIPESEVAEGKEECLGVRHGLRKT